MLDDDLFVSVSTNGTVINMSKVVKKQTHLLQNDDVIHFVYRKNEPEQSKFSHLSIFCFYSIVASKQMTQIGHVTHLFSVLQTLLMFIRSSGYRKVPLRTLMVNTFWIWRFIQRFQYSCYTKLVLLLLA